MNFRVCFRSLSRAVAAGALLSSLSLLAAPAQAQVFCVFDPLGASGDAFANAKDYQLAAKAWGVNLELKPYTDEGVAVEDFKTGQCDMTAITGLRARQFNQFTGTIDSVGGLENYTQMRKLLELMASPKLDKLMVSGQYEVGGIFALGAGYAFVNDRKIDKLAKAAGKKIAVMDWDKTQAILVQELGAQPVLSDITNFAGKFNNGQVDIIVAPAIVFKPFELYKGLGTKGAIARFPIVNLTAQMVFRAAKFPAGYGEKSRAYVAGQINRNFEIVKKQEADIDAKYWMEVPESDRDGYTKVMRDARLRLAADGYYDRHMLAILKRVRCESHPSDAECAMTQE